MLAGYIYIYIWLRILILICDGRRADRAWDYENDAFAGVSVRVRWFNHSVGVVCVPCGILLLGQHRSPGMRVEKDSAR